MEAVQLHTSMRIAAPPAPDAVPLEWWAKGDELDAHLYPRPPVDGFPPRALCGERWQVTASHVGAGHCSTCLTVAVDQHASLGRALAAAAAFGLAAGDHHVGVGR